MKMMIDNDGDAVMIDATQIKSVTKVVINETEAQFEIVYYNSENALFVFEFEEFKVTKEITVSNVEKIRNDILLYLNGNAEPELMCSTINLSKK